MPAISFKVFVNEVIKGLLFLLFFIVGYMYGITNGKQEILESKQKIAYLEKITYDQQIEIDRFKNHYKETYNIKATIDDLNKRVESLETLIKKNMGEHK